MAAQVRTDSHPLVPAGVDSGNSAYLGAIERRIAEINERIRQILSTGEGFALVAAAFGLGGLFATTTAVYLFGEVGLTMLFLAITIMGTPVALFIMSKAGRPLWRLATERAQLNDLAERLRYSLGLPSSYKSLNTLAASPDSGHGMRSTAHVSPLLPSPVTMRVKAGVSAGAFVLGIAVALFAMGIIVGVLSRT